MSVQASLSDHVAQQSITDACQQAGIQQFTLHRLMQFVQGHGIKGTPSSSYVLVIQYTPSDIKGLCTVLDRFMQSISYYRSPYHASLGVVIAPGVYTLNITYNGTITTQPQTALHTSPVRALASVTPINGKQSIKSKLKVFEGGKIVAKLSDGEVDTWLKTNGNKFFQHEDDSVQEFEWNIDAGDDGDNAFITVLVYSNDHSHTSSYRLYFDTQYHPVELVISPHADDCRTCNAETNEEDRLWRGPYAA